MFLQRPKKASMTFYLRPRYYSFVRKQGTTAELRLKTHLSLLYVKYSVILCPRNNMHVSLRVLTVAWSWRIRHDNATRDKHWTGISPNRDQCQRRTLILISAIGHSSIDSTSGKAETDSALWTAVATFHIQDNNRREWFQKRKDSRGHAGIDQLTPLANQNRAQSKWQSGLRVEIFMGARTLYPPLQQQQFFRCHCCCN